MRSLSLRSKYFITSSPVTLFCQKVLQRHPQLAHFTAKLSIFTFIQVHQITTGLSVRSSRMSVDSVDKNLSLTFHFIATSNIQHNAKLQHSICPSAGIENRNKQCFRIVLWPFYSFTHHLGVDEFFCIISLHLQKTLSLFHRSWRGALRLSPVMLEMYSRAN